MAPWSSELKHKDRPSATKPRAPARWAAAMLCVPALVVAVQHGVAMETRRSLEVRIEQRQVTRPHDRRLVVRKGERVSIDWHADERGELHVHGYDLTVRLDPQRVVRTELDARATGRFPVTSHGFGEATGESHGHGALLYLEVHPE